MRIDKFLIDRITEDEEAALDALHVELKYTEGATVEYRWARITSYPNGGSGSAFEPGCPSPARVLAECGAKRRIIDDDVQLDRVVGLRILAAVYADHPDFDPAWVVDSTPP